VGMWKARLFFALSKGGEIPVLSLGIFLRPSFPRPLWSRLQGFKEFAFGLLHELCGFPVSLRTAAMRCKTASEIPGVNTGGLGKPTGFPAGLVAAIEAS